MLKAIAVITLLSAIISGVLTESMASSTEDGAEVSELVQARSCRGLTSKLLLLLNITICSLIFIYFALQKFIHIMCNNYLYY